ncbi:MAG: hypothetical protein AB1473_23200 [Thermodesulfobacteriota bacterium]
MRIRPVKRILLGPMLALLFLGHGFAYDIWQAPPGQPEQMRSRVDYDPKLTDRFLESDQWICRYGSSTPAACRDGKPVLILSDPCNPLLPDTCFELREWSCPDGCKECATCERGKPVVKHTAKCYSTSFGVKHTVNFCEARLINGQVIDLLIHESRGAFSDSMLVRIRDGKFTCQYWNHDGAGAVTWTTTRQKLALDKKAYAKGDMIKGRLDVEGLSEFKPKYAEKFGRNPRTIKVFGVFKTIVE